MTTFSRQNLEEALFVAYATGNGGTEAWKEALYKALHAGEEERRSTANHLRMRSRQAVYDISRYARDLEEGFEEGWPAEVLESAQQMQAIAEPILTPSPAGQVPAGDDRTALSAAWRDGYYSGKRDYAASHLGGTYAKTPNPHQSGATA